MKHTIYLPERNNCCITAVYYAPLFIGMLAGAIKVSGNISGISPLIHQYIAPVYSGGTVGEVFWHTMTVTLLCTGIAFMFGLCAVGQPFGIALLLYRGFGIGVSAAVQYEFGGVKALPEVLLLLLPKALVCTALTFLAVRELLRSSGSLLRFMCKADEMQRPEMKLYCIRFGVIAALSVAAAAVDALLNFLLAGVL